MAAGTAATTQTARQLDVGDPNVLTCTFTLAGVATDPTTVTLKYEDPSGNQDTKTYAAAQITRSSAGVFTYTLTNDESGTWTWRWIATGTVDAVDEGSFYVLTSDFVTPSPSTPTLTDTEILEDLGVAFIPAAGDGVQYVSTEGDDDNDGLTWGRAKLTVQDAIDALPDSGGNVFIGQGSFAISSALTVPSNVALQGSGWGTVLVTAAATTGIKNSNQTAGNARIVIRDLKLDVSASFQTNKGIELITADAISGTVDDCLIENVLVLGSGSANSRSTVDAIQIGSTANTSSGTPKSALSARNLVRNCRIDGCDGPIRLKNCRDSAIDSCYSKNSLYGFFIQTNCYKCEVRNCTTKDTWNIAVALESSLIKCSAVNNRINTLASGSSYAGYAINTEQTDTDLRIVNNVIDGHVTGIRVTQSTGTLVVSGNQIMGTTGGSGISITSADGGTVSGNSIKTVNRSCIRLTTCTDMTVSGNYCADGNGAASTFDGIWLEASTECVVTGNRCLGTNRYGIAESSSANNNVISANNVEGNATGGINKVGAGSIVRNNHSHVTENSGTGSIASGATSATITHGLAATPAAKNISVTFTENPTNDPGNVWVSNITSTQFNVNVRSDPGASNLDFSWQAVIL